MSKKKFDAIMLIDDNELENLINQKTIENYGLSKYVYVHTGATSAMEFLKNVEKLKMADEIIPDLIILDLDMPFMDGFQFLEEFNKLSTKTKKKVKIMILTSSKSNDDLAQSKNYTNVKRFVRKPLSHKDIARINTQ